MDDWLRSARPLFTILSASSDWSRERIQRRVQEAVDDGCDTIMAFVSDEGYALWPSRFAPIAPRTDGQDLVDEWVRATKRAGLRFVAQWMGVHVQTVIGARHPSWSQRDAHGRPTGVMCVNTAFGSYLLGQIREVVAAYPVDGVYLDGLYARQGGCYCASCRSTFEVELERPLPQADASAVAMRDDDAHWLDGFDSSKLEAGDLATFRFSTVANFVERLRRSIDSARPGTALILDTVGIQAGYWPNGQDLRRLSNSVDAFALECYPDQIHEPLWHAAFESELLRAETERPIWALRWISRDPDGDLVSIPAATLYTHVATSVAHGTLPTIVEMDLYSVDDSLRPEVQAALTHAQRSSSCLEGARRERWAGVLSHRPLIDAAAARGDIRRALDPVAGAWLALTEAHLPVEVIDDRALGIPERLDELGLLVVPDVSGLSSADAEAIISAVERGMGLVVTARSLIGPLAQRLGIETAGVGFRAGEIGPEASGGSELVNYVRTDSHDITRPVAPDLWSYPGLYVRVTSMPGERLGSILDANLGAMDGERWFGWLPGDPAWPLGSTFGVGAGRVVALAAPLETVFYHQGRPEAASIVSEAAGYVARCAPHVAVEAPPTVESSTWESDDGLVICFANRTTNDLYAIGAGVPIGAATSSMSGSASGRGTMRAQFPRVVIPVGGITASFDWAGAEPRVETAAGRSVEVTRDGDRITLGIDALGAYETIRVRRRHSD